MFCLLLWSVVLCCALLCYDTVRPGLHPHFTAWPTLPLVASKHALQGFFTSLRAEVAKDGISVTVLSPGYVRTELSRNALTGDGGRYNIMDDNTAKGFPPEKVAWEILAAVARGEVDVVMATPTVTAAVQLNAVFPTIMASAMKSRI